MELKDESPKVVSGFVDAGDMGPQTGAGGTDSILRSCESKGKEGKQSADLLCIPGPRNNASFCTNKLANDLHLRGKNVNILLTTMGEQKTVSCKAVPDLEVSSLEGDDFIELTEVFAQKVIPTALRSSAALPKERPDVPPELRRRKRGCRTGDNKTLDLFYANTKEAYHSLPLPPLGRADHNLVHLQPVYKPLVQRQPAVTRTVKKWSEKAEEVLKHCFDTTLWDVFSDNLTHCITDYINFCVENTVPTRTVWSFSNSKPWITPDIKALLKEKKRAFVSGDKEELKTVQRELRRKIRQEKDNYRRKMENQLQQNNICGVWKGLKTISGFKEQKSQPVGDRGGLTT
ncbi:uncharacterized protein LOC130520960 [Takifugu flavidus]|uniref:uncharacterized protein LOC130520960 n=1 Tax=Takifugu flavidus TaxID=433684 RepID=UPI002543FD43|nr:uncharacterized protein LOC130520960 [Takifugu flavidus]